MLERIVPRRRRGFLAAVALILPAGLAGCASSSLPGGTFPGGGGYVPTGEDGSYVVEYWVQCRGCEVVFTTPRGMESVEEDDAFRRTVRFDVTVSAQSVSLHVHPELGDAVVRASISVNGRMVADVRRSRNETFVGEPVFLSANLGG